MRFAPGQSGNPNGRPKGSGLSITTEIKRALQERDRSKGNKKNLTLLIEKIMKKAIKDGDNHTIKQMWNYIDGLPVQKVQGEVTVHNYDWGNYKDIPPEDVDESSA